jgi:hypothetical protein
MKRIRTHQAESRNRDWYQSMTGRINKALTEAGLPVREQNIHTSELLGDYITWDRKYQTKNS